MVDGGWFLFFLILPALFVSFSVSHLLCFARKQLAISKPFMTVQETYVAFSQQLIPFICVWQMGVKDC